MAIRTSGFNNKGFRQMYIAFVLITGPPEPVTMVMWRGKHCLRFCQTLLKPRETDFLILTPEL